MARVTVYVLDDHPIYLHGLARTIGERPDLELVGQSDDARRGLDEIKRVVPDVSVLDVRMPGLDGAGVTAALREAGVATKVLFLSGALESHVVYEGLAVGARGYVSKAEPPQAVCEAILRVARGETVIPEGLQGGVVDEIQAREARNRPALTTRESEVLRLIAEGLSAPEIGARLYLSAATVRSHMKTLYEKLGVSERAAAVAVAMRYRLLD